MHKLFLIYPLLFLISCTEQKLDYKSFKDAQDYSLKTLDFSSTNKTALLLFPHPDDEIICAGTISFLKEKGWKVYLITLTQGQKEEKNTRKKEWENACITLNLDHYEIFDLPNNSWENVLSNEIDFWYDQQDSLERMISRLIIKYKPSILITYDTELGGYGHPEHRMTALAAQKVFERSKKNKNYPLERILQITLPENLEKLILGGKESYLKAIQTTGNPGLPEPNLAVDIPNKWPIKREAAAQYISQAPSLKKFYQLPALADTSLHYQSFDREYFLEIKR